MDWLRGEERRVKLVASGHLVTPLLHLRVEAPHLVPACVHRAVPLAWLVGRKQLLPYGLARHPTVLRLHLEQRDDGLPRDDRAKQLAYHRAIRTKKYRKA